MLARAFATLCFALLCRPVVAQVDVAVLGHLRSAPSWTATNFAVDAETEGQAFRTLGDFMIVEATVDGARGSFILDSGAPGLILNGVVREAVDSARALDRYVPIGQQRVRTLHWGPLEQRGVVAYVLDLRHLEASFGEPIAGLIGYEQLRQLPLVIDYPRRELTFLRKHAEARAQGIPLPFVLFGHLPLVEAEVGGRPATLGFDTGSGLNLLNADYLSLVAPSSAELPAMRVRGLGATAATITRRSVGLTRTSNANWVNLPYGFADLSALSESETGTPDGGPRLDGLLGKEWMERRVVTIDYARRRLYVR